MPEKTLDPGNDEDFLNILLHDNEITMKKVSVKKGEASSLAPGNIKRGKVKRFRIGEHIKIEGEISGETTRLEKIEINDAIGSIRLHTKTSVYDLISVDKSKASRYASLSYCRRGFLDFYQNMPDGFIDGGRHMEFKVDEKGKMREIGYREIILLDTNVDPGLRQVLTETQELLKGITDMQTKIKMLALYISNRLGGKHLNDYPGSHISDLTENDIETVLKKTDGVHLPIGALNHGVCRHRALLFKYLADRNGIPSRLVRGDYGSSASAHVWNVVKLGEKYFIVDVMHDPTQLYEENSDKAKKYTRRNNKGIAGGFGGRSIEMPK